jgi:hypothetical protein
MRVYRQCAAVPVVQGLEAGTTCTANFELLRIVPTQHHLCRRFGWQPEDDERYERQQEARQHKNVTVENGDSFDRNGERQIGKRFDAARVIADVLLGWMVDQLPFVAFDVVTDVDLSKERVVQTMPT